MILISTPACGGNDSPSLYTAVAPNPIPIRFQSESTCSGARGRHTATPRLPVTWPGQQEDSAGPVGLITLDSALFPLLRLLWISSAQPRRRCGARFGFDCTGCVSGGRRKKEKNLRGQFFGQRAAQFAESQTQRTVSLAAPLMTAT